MAVQFSVLCQILIFLAAAQLSIGGHFEYVLDDESVFSECFDMPPGYANISGLFDVSTINFEMGPEGVHVDGYLTSSWDIQPTDRIEGRLNVVHMDRGTWQPTVLNMVSRDFCKTFLDPNQYWYNIFPKHIINRDEARQKCLNYKGTVYFMEPYTLQMHFGLGLTLPSGRNRMVFNLVAIDENNVTRPNGICFEIEGDFFKIE
ncbi:uncharacterized protein LOC6738496 [Drosophila simulans]|uniref:GD12386 n=1 Tax=Drosophila simulans TaxID=7240 RepID=B4QNY5_DROSI|nr:uncharacterized protein LOC6738496 [Drosophila simulans]EDX10887.1 GD12386 [Drosophila simulans]KMZ00295.1 uncharacterized protein Dsimw501_GD12386 [Drosophila simulans]